ncbi:MAG: hypothetical protein ABFC54_12525 [Thermoguttaceae bacterium]
MRLPPISLSLLALLTACSWAAAAEPPISTVRQSLFAIPYRIDQTGGDASRQPVEVQLFVSTDRGKRWQMYARAMPNQQRFMFRAGNDGEYWFAIRTVERSGQARPESIATPGLRVIVDTRGQNTKSPNAVGPSGTQTASNNSPSPSNSNANSNGQGSVAIAINPAIGRKASNSEGPTFGVNANSDVPQGEHPRMVNSLTFELDYDVESVGPSGIGRVELWGTRDGGRSWRRYRTDGDRRSPLVAHVDDEGVYGFRVVVTNGSGLGGKAPAAGDLPDLWIGVDQTKPTARIVSAQQGVDAEAGRLIIAWQADDQALAARPVSLSFRAETSGPWLPIASGLENTGRYAWPIDGRTPAQFYLRLEVRDEAGNVGVYQTSDLVTVDQSRPKIRIRDVRPVSRNGG